MGIFKRVFGRKKNEKDYEEDHEDNIQSEIEDTSGLSDEKSINSDLNLNNIEDNDAVESTDSIEGNYDIASKDLDLDTHEPENNYQEKMTTDSFNNFNEAISQSSDEIVSSGEAIDSQDNVDSEDLVEEEKKEELVEAERVEEEEEITKEEITKEVKKEKEGKQDKKEKSNISEDNGFSTEVTAEETDIKDDKGIHSKNLLNEREEARKELLSTDKPRSLTERLKERLTKSRVEFFGKIKNLFSSKDVIDEELYEELEELLILSDIGLDMSLKIVDRLEETVKERKIKKPSEIYEVLKEILEEFLILEDNELKINKDGLNLILVVGVNGVGKTTTIGKLASSLIAQGKKVVIGAGDTFRAAAIEQLEEWATRSGADIIKHSQGADPGAVVFDTIKAAKEKQADVVIIDTAGRLHNKSNLMNELQKINNIIEKQIGSSEYESLLVIDGTTGQNGLNQAKTFNEVTKLTGFIVTKLDGTAKGGIIFAVSDTLQKPVKFIGIGEGIDDLQPFNPKAYIDALFN